MRSRRRGSAIALRGSTAPWGLGGQVGLGGRVGLVALEGLLSLLGLLPLVASPLSGQVVPLVADGLQIGRAEPNQVRIIEASVSGRHARIWQEKGGWWVQDLKSTNGTLVNNAEAPPNVPIG